MKEPKKVHASIHNKVLKMFSCLRFCINPSHDHLGCTAGHSTTPLPKRKPNLSFEKFHFDASDLQEIKFGLQNDSNGAPTQLRCWRPSKWPRQSTTICTNKMDKNAVEIYGVAGMGEDVDSKKPSIAAASLNSTHPEYSRIEAHPRILDQFGCRNLACSLKDMVFAARTELEGWLFEPKR